jgi:xanthine dehydrogenase/oxidase
MYEEDGRLYSNGTWDYKPPCSKSIPVDFRVMLHRTERRRADGKPADDTAVLSSRAIGEPPLVLSTTAFFAIKHAIMAARRDQGDNSWVEIDAPATVARVQSACRVKRDQLKL